MYKYDKEVKIDSLIMPAEDKIIISFNRFILVIDLREKTEKMIRYSPRDPKELKVFVFGRTQMFCFEDIVE